MPAVHFLTWGTGYPEEGLKEKTKTTSFDHKNSIPFRNKPRENIDSLLRPQRDLNGQRLANQSLEVTKHLCHGREHALECSKLATRTLPTSLGIFAESAYGRAVCRWYCPGWEVLEASEGWIFILGPLVAGTPAVSERHVSIGKYFWNIIVLAANFL